MFRNISLCKEGSSGSCDTHLGEVSLPMSVWRAAPNNKEREREEEKHEKELFPHLQHQFLDQLQARADAIQAEGLCAFQHVGGFLQKGRNGGRGGAGSRGRGELRKSLSMTEGNEKEHGKKRGSGVAAHLAASWVEMLRQRQGQTPHVMHTPRALLSREGAACMQKPEGEGHERGPMDGENKT